MYVMYYTTTQNFDDATITEYSGHPMNVYRDLSIDKKKKKYDNRINIEEENSQDKEYIRNQPI